MLKIGAIPALLEGEVGEGEVGEVCTLILVVIAPLLEGELFRKSAKLEVSDI